MSPISEPNKETISVNIARDTSSPNDVNNVIKLRDFIRAVNPLNPIDVNNENDVIKLNDLVKAVNALNPNDVSNNDSADKVGDVNKIDSVNNKASDVNNDSTREEIPVLNFCNSTEFKNKNDPNAIEKIDISFSPSIIVPLISKEGGQYRVRTLIDSGSGANWITQKILAFVEHTVLGQSFLNIETFNGMKPGKFQIVEIYYFADKEGKEKQAITCFVHDKFTKHVTVNGLVDYIIRYGRTRKSFQNLVDPATKRVDHAEIDLGTGLILSTAGFNVMRAPQPNIMLKEHNILIEHTIFGNAISGKVPDDLKQHVKILHQYNVTPIFTVGRPKGLPKGQEEIFPSDNKIPHDDIEFLWNKENIGIMNDEVHSDDKKAWEKFQESVRYNKASREFTVRLPWNDRRDQLKTNILGAAARTRNQQRQFIKEKEAYGVPCVNAFNKLVADDQVERVNMNKMPQGLEHYLPWRGIMKTESQTTKCRLVMDASAKPSASDVSLNQCLYQGPNMILDLVFCLIKFMKGIYAAVSDIEKAFLKILIDLLDRDVLRLFFPEVPFDIVLL